MLENVVLFEKIGRKNETFGGLFLLHVQKLVRRRFKPLPRAKNRSEVMPVIYIKKVFQK